MAVTPTKKLAKDIVFGTPDGLVHDSSFLHSPCTSRSRSSGTPVKQISSQYSPLKQSSKRTLQRESDHSTDEDEDQGIQIKDNFVICLEC